MRMTTLMCLSATTLVRITGIATFMLQHVLTYTVARETMHCLSGESVVTLANGTNKIVSNIAVGDYIDSKNNKVEFFLHRY